MKILLDSNVVLDVFLRRIPYYEAGAAILGLSKEGVELFISASAITDIFYITRKSLDDKKAAMSLLKNLLINVDVAAVSGGEIRRAIDLGWNDFEDALQYAVGEGLGADYIITRNTADFVSTALPVATPDEFLSSLTAKDD
jgi:predicted nucleic acid-binding protein